MSKPRLPERSSGSGSSSTERLKVLIVDDDGLYGEDMKAFLSAEFSVDACFRPEEAMARIEKNGADIVLLDIDFDGAVTGIEVLRALRQRHRYIPVIMVTKIVDPQIIVECMKAGACDYFDKSPDLGKLSISIARAIKATKTERERDVLKEMVAERESDMIGAGPAMVEVGRKAEEAARGGYPVLILGETGVGKDVVAREIHKRSSRRGGPFLRFNCASIPASLFESELFGFEKGAFTGAQARYAGKFEMARDGTLFLDEIGEIEVGLQSKLLQAIETGEISKIGGSNAKVDVRVIAATNRDLQDEVKAGRFRKDLFYRLNIYPIKIPPLRERAEDIEALAEYFLDRYGREYHKQGLRIDDAARAYLKALSWPGNVRELENAVQRAVISASGPELGMEQFLFLQEDEANYLFLSYHQARAGLMEDFQKKYLQFHLKKAGGNISRACEAMGISRQMLHGWLKKGGPPETEPGWPAEAGAPASD